jgi:ribosomal protein S18 acetylase RimI-like enzyme
VGSAQNFAFTIVPRKFDQLLAALIDTDFGYATEKLLGMIRLATLKDLTPILEICESKRHDNLSDLSAVTGASALRLIEAQALWVWQEPTGLVVGFSGADIDNGSIWALAVAPDHDGKGIGRALLQVACEALRAAGRDAATINAPVDSARHYRAAGWSEVGPNTSGGLIFRKPL